MSKSRTSIRDVAAMAGVSRTTVSLVLNNSPIPSASTRKKVLEAANSLNYVPSPLYRQAFKNARQSENAEKTRTNTVGFLSSEFILDRSQRHDGYYSRVRLGIEKSLGRLGYELMTRSVTADLRGLPPMVSDGKVDGLLVEANLDKELASLLSAQIPVVYVDVLPPADPADAVLADFARGVQAQFEHLWNLGHRRIATFQPRSQNHQERVFLSAYRELSAKAGMAPQEFERDITMETHEAVLGKLAHELAGMADRPTALITWDAYACTLLEMFEPLSLSVPRDLSVIGMDDTMMARMTRPKLTSYRFPLDEMGSAAAEMLVSRIESPSSSSRVLSLTGELVVRESCGAPPAR